MKPFSASAAASRGFTLLELGIVIGILALAAAVVVPSLSAVLGVETREQVARVAGSMRAMYGAAVLQGKTCRMVFDLDGGGYWPECAEGRVRVKRTEESIRGARIEEEEKRLGDSDEDQARRQVQERASFSAYEADLAPKAKLPAGVKFESVWTQHQTEPYTSGTAFLYFFPNGRAERAYIHVASEDDVYTIIVNPMTGRTKVVAEKVDVPNEELRR